MFPQICETYRVFFMHMFEQTVCLVCFCRFPAANRISFTPYNERCCFKTDYILTCRLLVPPFHQRSDDDGRAEVIFTQRYRHH